MLIFSGVDIFWCYYMEMGEYLLKAYTDNILVRSADHNVEIYLE